MNYVSDFTVSEVKTSPDDMIVPNYVLISLRDSYSRGTSLFHFKNDLFSLNITHTTCFSVGIIFYVYLLIKSSNKQFISVTMDIDH